MSRCSKPVIAVNEDGTEYKYYHKVNACARDLSVSNAAVIMAIARGGKVCGWNVYDTPDNIRKRIGVLKQQIDYLEDMLSLADNND